LDNSGQVGAKSSIPGKYDWLSALHITCMDIGHIKFFSGGG